MMSPACSRRDFLATGIFTLANPLGKGSPKTRSFWLFGLLRPQCVIIQAAGNARLHCSDSTRQWTIEGSQTLCITRNMSPVNVSGPAGSPVNCLLEIPGLVRRPYLGTLELCAGAEYMVPLLTMDFETAANCIVAAELPVSAAPLDALATQAVVSRSVLVALRAGRHGFADFCDTTHCQFLRSPVSRPRRVADAVQDTAGIVLAQDNSILPARYSAACGGRTEAGFDAGHRYISVSCKICRERKLARRGHGWGLCQEGAMGLARRGYTWREILATYYPLATPMSSESQGAIMPAVR